MRRFALALHAENARHQVPATDALGTPKVKRRPPYLYRPDEIVRLLRAAAARTGRLDAAGHADGLVIRESKFQKSRLLPLHTTTRQALDGYLLARRQAAVAGHTLLVSIAGRSLPSTTVRNVFLHHLNGTKPGRDPRIHTGLDDTHMQALIAEVLAARS
jgi:integrase